jgi:putative transposase
LFFAHRCHKREFLLKFAARLRHIAGTRWGTRRYLNMNLLTELKKEEEIAA